MNTWYICEENQGRFKDPANQPIRCHIIGKKHAHLGQYGYIPIVDGNIEFPKLPGIEECDMFLVHLDEDVRYPGVKSCYARKKDVEIQVDGVWRKYAGKES